MGHIIATFFVALLVAAATTLGIFGWDCTVGGAHAYADMFSAAWSAGFAAFIAADYIPL